MKKDEVTIGELLKVFMITASTTMVTYGVTVGALFLGTWLFSIGLWFGATYIALIVSIIIGALGVRELLK